MRLERVVACSALVACLCAGPALVNGEAWEGVVRGAAESETATQYWIDKDTPKDAFSIKSPSDGKQLTLVASDEFNSDGRSFANGKDKMWTALDGPDVTNDALEYMSPDAATTKDGALVIELTQRQMGGRNYVGAHLQSWNKFCYTGGLFVVRNKWPSGGGVWPAAWLMGNLGRPQYEQSNMGVWPWSYNKCDAAATKQKISACNANPGPGLYPNQGRGAPEFDLVEAWTTGEGFNVISLQIAPSIPQYYRPRVWNADPAPSGPGSWYRGVTYENGQNAYYGHDKMGYSTDAVASRADINQDARFSWQTYSFDWKPGPDGYVNGYYENQLIVGVPGSALGKYCDPTNPSICTGEREVPSEPMAIILNLVQGSASSWALGPAKATYPSYFYIDYVRIYQDPKAINIGCDPPKYPTKEYIEANSAIYGPEAIPEPPLNASFYFYAHPQPTTKPPVTTKPTTNAPDTTEAPPSSKAKDNDQQSNPTTAKSAASDISISATVLSSACLLSSLLMFVRQ